MIKSNKQFVDAISADVMKVLARVGFFGKLDDKLSPSDKTIAPAQCQGKYEISEPLLRSLGFKDEDRVEILQVLQSKGGLCDCEILYNAAETSRLKSNYWKARAAGLEATHHKSH